MISNIWTQCITILTIGYTIVNIYQSRSIANYEIKKIELEKMKIEYNKEIEILKLNSYNK
jgi:hypothetical protein